MEKHNFYAKITKKKKKKLHVTSFKIDFTKLLVMA